VTASRARSPRSTASRSPGASGRTNMGGFMPSSITRHLQPRLRLH
jgi:hypothetical protein